MRLESDMQPAGQNMTEHTHMYGVPNLKVLLNANTVEQYFSIYALTIKFRVTC